MLRAKRPRSPQTTNLESTFIMTLQEIIANWDTLQEAPELYAIAEDLFPICRSITGEGVRDTLKRLRKYAAMALHEVPTGTKIHDWTVPKEWNIRDAYIKNAKGERIIDFAKCNLHVVNYSTPVHGMMALDRLKEHIHTLPETPDWIPYRTSYYSPNWGFCMSHRQFLAMKDREYEVCIDATLEPGHMTIGEFRIQGQIDREVLISCHCCHPSLGNDNLTGMAIGAILAKKLSKVSLRYSYRFLWMPGTVGAIAWLALNEQIIPKIKHGLVLSCLGDPGGFSYKRSRKGNSEIDRIVENQLLHSGKPYQICEFTPYGYDERQYCSPGYNLPVGCFMRTPNGKYPEYHTSADNLDLISGESMAESLFQLLAIISAVENNRRFLNQNPKCEPQLGRRGLYQQTGGARTQPKEEEAMLWVLNFSDGEHSLLDISSRAGIPFNEILQAAQRLEQHGLLRRLG